MYVQILSANPRDAAAWFELGNMLGATGHIADAATAFQNAVAAKPDFAEAYCNLGNASQILGELSNAKSAFERAVQLRPNFAEAWNNLGNIAQDQGDAAGALSLHQHAARLRPGFVQAWFSLGGALRTLGQLDEALAAYDEALKIQPTFDKAEVNRANVLRDMGRLQDAIEGLQRAMQLYGRPDTLSNLVYLMPLHPAYDAKAIWPLLQRWDTEFAQPLASEIRPHTNVPTPERRLRIGYVSPDFNIHPAGRFVLPLLENHDHAQFEVFCYSDSRFDDEVTARTRKAADQWRETRKLSDQQLADRIREDQIDILVDLTAHMAGNRLLTFARKPAPVQLNWLSYPGTTGVEAIDYRVSDPYLDPPGDQQFYSEETITLPDCYWCYDPLVQAPIEPGELPAGSAGYITFGSLNNFAKVSDATIDLWARTMRQVVNSRLMLLGPAGSSRLRFENQMASHGIAQDRISWLDRMPRDVYLAAYRRFDIVLDSFPCGGHTTTFDALWMGVPVLTMVGKTAFSRGGLSVLSNLKMPGWIAQDAGDFVEKARTHASDLTALAEVRRSLRQRVESSSLMDKRRFARNMETAYRQIWRNWCERR